MKDTSLAFNVLIKQEDGMWVAHCLELDIVAVEPTSSAAERSMADLIAAQVSYALDNDNIDHLFKAAPKDVWLEFMNCGSRRESRFAVEKPKASGLMGIISNACFVGGNNHAQPAPL